MSGDSIAKGQDKIAREKSPDGRFSVTGIFGKPRLTTLFWVAENNRAAMQQLGEAAKACKGRLKSFARKTTEDPVTGQTCLMSETGIIVPLTRDQSMTWQQRESEIERVMSDVKTKTEDLWVKYGKAATKNQ